MNSKYDIAKRRVKKKADFRSHLASYVVVIGFLFVLNLFTSPGYLWAIWPAMGWGIGLLFHGLTVSGVIADEDKEEEMIAEEMRRMETRELEEGQQEEEDHLELKEIRKERLYRDDELV